MPTPPPLPNATQRITILGATGSGKTVAGIYHLSMHDLKARPWVVADMKDDEHLNAIESAQHVDLDFTPKEKDKGIFIVHPRTRDEEALDKMLERLYERTNVGIFMDEPDLANRSDAFTDILRKGRSRRMPVIALSQRPVDVTRYLFSEASYIRAYYLNDKRDWRTVEEFTPIDSEIDLKPFHSFYYQVGRKDFWQLGPAPSVEQSLDKIDAQLRRERILL